MRSFFSSDRTFVPPSFSYNYKVGDTMKKIIHKNGKLIFNVDGKEVAPAAYMSYCPKDADYDGFRELGYKLYSYCVYSADIPTNEEHGFLRSWEKGCFVGENSFDFSPLDLGMERVFGGNFENGIYVILRININMPQWWRDKYPEELMHYKGGRRLMQSVCSRAWRRDAMRFLTALQKHIKNSPYSKNIIGWQIAAMQTEEWIHPNATFCNLVCDKPCENAFKNYCEEKYQDISLLNTKWGENLVNFDGITLPSAEATVDKRINGVEKPSSYKVKDFYTFLANAYADAIIFYGEQVKKLYDGDIFYGAFYGYIGQLQDIHAHSAISKVIDSEAVDFLASPFAYVDGRAMGVDWIYHAPMKTIDKHGKIWFIESDVRTCLTRHLADTRPDVGTREQKYLSLPAFFGPSTAEQSVNNIVRSFSKFFISQNAFWWFDMWGGWYKKDVFMSLHDRLYRLYLNTLDITVENNSQIALVLDENSSYYISSQEYTHSVYEQTVEMGKMGAPYDLLLLDKVDGDDIKKYGLFVFERPAFEDSESAEKLIGKIKSHGKKVVITGKHEKCDGEFFTHSALAEICREAGVHVYCEGAIVYANARFLSVTTLCEGSSSLLLPSGVKALRDLISDEIIPVSGGKSEIRGYFNKTFFFEML